MPVVRTQPGQSPQDKAMRRDALQQMGAGREQVPGTEMQEGGQQVGSAIGSIWGPIGAGVGKHVGNQAGSFADTGGGEEWMRRWAIDSLGALANIPGVKDQFQSEQAKEAAAAAQQGQQGGAQQPGMAPTQPGQQPAAVQPMQQKPMVGAMPKQTPMPAKKGPIF